MIEPRFRGNIEFSVALLAFDTLERPARSKCSRAIRLSYGK